MNVDSTNSSEENDSKTSNHELEVRVSGTKDVVGYDDRDNDDVGYDCTISRHKKLGESKSRVPISKSLLGSILFEKYIWLSKSIFCSLVPV